MKIILLNELNLKALTNVSALSLEESKQLLPEIISIDLNNMKYSWTRASWENSLQDPHFILIYFADIGFALFQKSPLDTVLHLLKIVVKKEQRGFGNAVKLFEEGLLILEALHSDIESIYLEVEEGNSRAIGFYIKLGFTVIHQKKNFYSDGEGALFMQKALVFKKNEN